jgi:hypothetical protein
MGWSSASSLDAKPRFSTAILPSRVSAFTTYSIECPTNCDIPDILARSRGSPDSPEGRPLPFRLLNHPYALTQRKPCLRILSAGSLICAAADGEIVSPGNAACFDNNFKTHATLFRRSLFQRGTNRVRNRPAGFVLGSPEPALPLTAEFINRELKTCYRVSR